MPKSTTPGTSTTHFCQGKLYHPGLGGCVPKTGMLEMFHSVILLLFRYIQQVSVSFIIFLFIFFFLLLYFFYITL